MTKLKDLTGRCIGRLTVLERAQDHIQSNGKKIAMWKCECECGNLVVIRAPRLNATKQPTLSCGCLQRETAKATATKHGGDGTRLYRIYRDMVNRCYDEKNKGYHNYGGRGITICAEWRDDYAAFRRWAYANGYDDTAPRGKYTIDRIDVNGNYEPSNCRWADMKTQCNNTRFNLRYIVNGEDMTLKQIAEKYNVNYHSLYARVRLRGWDIYDAITLPRGTVINPTSELSKKRVVRIEDNQVFVSVKEAAEQMGCNSSLISMACRGKVRTALGYHWRYA